MPRNQKIDIDTRRGKITVIEKKFGCRLYAMYYINEKKKTVVCKLVPACPDNVNMITDHYQLAYVLPYQLMNRQPITRKTACHKSDKFDIEEGKKIAFNKCYRQFTMVANRIYENGLKEYENAKNALVKCQGIIINEFNNTVRRLNDVGVTTRHKI